MTLPANTIHNLHTKYNPDPNRDTNSLIQCRATASEITYMGR